MTVMVCLVDEVVPTRAMRTMLDVLLFYGRKAILLAWKKIRGTKYRYLFLEGPSKLMLPYYKATYEARGCMKKFNKVWHSWFNSSATVG